MVSRLKVLAGLDIACTHLPQDGACVVTVGNTAKSIRLSTLPTVSGESVVIRFLYARRLPQLSALGMEPTTVALVRRAINRTSGVVLLTGRLGVERPRRCTPSRSNCNMVDVTWLPLRTLWKRLSLVWCRFKCESRRD
jgi:hypothetical protein